MKHRARPVHRIMLTITLPLSLLPLACGSGARAIRVEVVEKGGGPLSDVTISVQRGSIRRDPLAVLFVTDEQGTVLVDSLARAPVEISVRAADPRLSSKTLSMPTSHDEKKPFRIELEPVPDPEADTTRRVDRSDIRSWRTK